MPLVDNLVHETSTSGGTGNFTLSRSGGEQRFSEAFGTGGSDVFYYFIWNRGATSAEWEIGTGHMSTANTLVRDTVLESSNGGSLVNFTGAGTDTKDVTNAYPVGLEFPHFTDHEPATTVNLFGNDYRTYGYFHVEDDDPTMSAGHAVGFHVHHETASGHAGGIAATQIVADIGVAPTDLAEALFTASNILTVQSADVSGGGQEMILEGGSAAVISGGGFLGAMAAWEIAAGAFNGSAPFAKLGLLIDDMGPVADTTFGSATDARICLSSLGGIGAKDQILMSDTAGRHPFPADGSGRIMRIVSGTTPTISTGIDLSGATITGNAFRSNAFTVDGDGDVAANSFSSAVHFVSDGGIITGGVSATDNYFIGAFNTSPLGFQSFLTFTSGNPPTLNATITNLAVTTALQPAVDNTVSCGASGARWTQVWAVNGAVQTSDPRYKIEVQPLPCGLSELLAGIEPIRFRWKDNPDRVHWGWNAEQWRSAMEAYGDWGGIVDPKDGPLGLRPDQIVPILWKIVQEQSARIEALEAQ